MSETLTKVEPVMFEDNGQIWHEMWDDEPDVTYCGLTITGFSLPSCEVPDEITCKACLKIKSRLKL